MATSAKQIAANRRNARKSTGPRTPEGRAVSSRNAITHGLHACDIILKSPHLSEDRSQYEHLLDSLIDELKPKGVLQEHLVLKIANCLWRYRRVINAETAQINRQLESAAEDIRLGYHRCILDDPDDPDSDDDDTSSRDANLIGSQSVPSESFRTSLLHYELRLDRQLTRALRLLYHLQLMQTAKSPPILSTENENPQNEPISAP